MKKKIFLNGRFLTQPITGVQRTAFELVKALDALIEEKTINADEFEFILIYSGEIKNPIELKFIKVCKKGILKSNLWEQFELPLYTAGYLLISMCTVSTLFKRKQLVIVHDASFIVNPAFFSFIFRTWYRFAISILGIISRQIITVSDFSKGELVKHLGFKEKKVTTIYNAANHILRFKEPGKEFIDKVSKLQPYCLAVSSLSANKNFKGLGEAIKKIDFQNYNMLIAGGISKSLQFSSAESSVVYLGYVSNEELKYLYSHASLFIFPSFYEGFGIPPLEAMILGCPVLASNTSSLPEVLGEACEYFDPHNVDEMAQKIKDLIQRPEKLELLKKKGYQRANLYDWKKSSMKLLTLFNKYSA